MNIDQLRWKLAGKYGVKVAKSEKCPMFFYTAMKETEHFLVARRDRKHWKIVMDVDYFVDNFLNEAKLP